MQFSECNGGVDISNANSAIRGNVNPFALWLNQQIQDRGWTQLTFATRANISPSTVSRLLAGETNPGVEFCQGTARALNVPLEDVMRRAGLLPAVPAPGKGDDLLTRLRRLPAVDQETVLDLWGQILAAFEKRGR